MGHSTFSKSFKEKSYEHKNFKELAKELLIAPRLLSKWRNEQTESGSASFQGRGVERTAAQVEFELFEYIQI